MDTSLGQPACGECGTEITGTHSSDSVRSAPLASTSPESVIASDSSFRTNPRSPLFPNVFRRALFPALKASGYGGILGFINVSTDHRILTTCLTAIVGFVVTYFFAVFYYAGKR